MLRVQDLRVSYAGAVQALRGVSLSVPEGAVVAVLGNNGAGKTTLLRALSGTLADHSGAITAGDDRVRRARAAARRRRRDRPRAASCRCPRAGASSAT